jgi:hypothetical protein
VADKTEGWEFIAKLDDTGVTTRAPQDVIQDAMNEESRYEWSFYQSFKDYEDYLQITDINGGITFVPKTVELMELVEFTKNKIPEI